MGKKNGSKKKTSASSNSAANQQPRSEQLVAADAELRAERIRLMKQAIEMQEARVSALHELKVERDDTAAALKTALASCRLSQKDANETITASPQRHTDPCAAPDAAADQGQEGTDPVKADTVPADEDEEALTIDEVVDSMKELQQQAEALMRVVGAHRKSTEGEVREQEGEDDRALLAAKFGRGWTQKHVVDTSDATADAAFDTLFASDDGFEGEGEEACDEGATESAAAGVKERRYRRKVKRQAAKKRTEEQDDSKQQSASHSKSRGIHHSADGDDVECVEEDSVGVDAAKELEKQRQELHHAATMAALEQLLPHMTAAKITQPKGEESDEPSWLGDEEEEFAPASPPMPQESSLKTAADAVAKEEDEEEDYESDFEAESDTDSRE